MPETCTIGKRYNRPNGICLARSRPYTLDVGTCMHWWGILNSHLVAEQNVDTPQSTCVSCLIVMTRLYLSDCAIMSGIYRTYSLAGAVAPAAGGIPATPSAPPPEKMDAIAGYDRTTFDPSGELELTGILFLFVISIVSVQLLMSELCIMLLFSTAPLQPPSYDEAARGAAPERAAVSRYDGT